MAGARTPRVRRATALMIALGVAVASGIVIAAPAAADAGDPAGFVDEESTDTGGESGAQEATDASALADYPGDPTAEARIVAEEDRRLIDARAIANAAQWTGVTQYRPYRIATGATYTLVLVAREVPYSFDDLLEYLPRSLVRQPDGSYLLTDNIVVDEGATLSIRSSQGLTLKLASSDRGFVSLVTMGGALQLAGSTDKPVAVTSWNADTGEADTETSDGRAYVRVTGGRAVFQNAAFSDLGFWSGMTGGVSLTGTDIDFAGASTVETTESGNPSIYGTELMPVGGEADAAGAEAVADDELGAEEENLSGYGYVSASIIGTTFERNAFGLFITSADGVDISESSADDNLVDGIVMHRYVTGSTIRSTTANNNAQDGFSLRRATTGIVLDRVSAQDNGRNGVTVNGGPLADGPSATGMPLGTYGNNEISASTVTGNTRYGVEVLSGNGVTVRDTEVTGGDMGIVVSGDSRDVSVTGNVLSGIARQAIALRDGPRGAVITRNDIVGSEQGVYVRDAVATISRNDIDAATRHGVTLVGASAGSVVEDNTLAGHGLSAVDVSRSEGVEVRENDTTAWTATKPLDVILRGIFQPLTVMWLTLGLVLVITALTGLSRRGGGPRNPYANLAPLASFTKGVASRDEIDAHSAKRADA